MSRLYGWCRSSNMNEKDHIVPSRVTKGGNQKTSWDDYEYGWIWLNMLLVGNQWSEQPKNVRFVPNTKTLSEWYFWSGQSVKSVSYIQDSKGSLHCMEINSPFKGSMHFPSSVQQDGLFQVLQINTRFCFNCWSVINALARLSTLTSASRAAHLTWVEDWLSAHLCPPGAQLFSAWAQPPLSDHLPSSDSQLSDYSAFHIIIVQQRRGASNGDSNLTHTK